MMLLMSIDYHCKIMRFGLCCILILSCCNIYNKFIFLLNICPIFVLFFSSKIGVLSLLFFINDTFFIFRLFEPDCCMFLFSFFLSFFFLVHLF